MDDQRRLDKLFSTEYADDLNKVSRSDIPEILAQVRGDTLPAEGSCCVLIIKMVCGNMTG